MKAKKLGLAACLALMGLAPPMGPPQATLVHYHITNAQSQVPPDFDVLFAPYARKARISFTGQPGYMLLDAGKHRMTMVLQQPNISFEIPTPRLFAPYFEWRDTMQFTPAGPGYAAGRPCQFWIAHTGRGDGRICFTNDGIPLHIIAGGKDGSTDIVATSVESATVDPQTFEPPEGQLSLKGLSPFKGL